MTRFVAFAALAAGALYVLDQSGTVRMSSGGGSGAGTFQGYANSSAPPINGIAKAAGG